ncbi:glycosyltransferase family 2 protein [Nocardioides montaniterrae]
MSAPQVSVLLVSHDGSSWLVPVLAGIAAQTAPIASIVAVDTGSEDGSADLIESTLNDGGVPAAVLRADARTTFPQAIKHAADALAEHGHQPEWLWILHDDSNPDPGALEALLAAAAARPDVDILGPKLREWPSLKRLLEVGVTISGTGRRETGLERGEYDQGQHDDVHEVLAVNSAGMLIRRDAFDALGGFDERLPMFGNDVDLGWRAAASGRTTLIVPQAVVFHAEAAHRGVRTTPLTGKHTHFQERRAALYTLMVNGRGAWLPLQAIRLVLGSMIRALGYLLVRSVGEALDEVAAITSVIAHPREILAGRASRRAEFADGTYDHENVRRHLAPWWLPYRHGLDFVIDLFTAASNQAADVAERRRIAAAENEPTKVQARHSTTEDDLEDNGWIVRFFTSPLAIAIALVALALLIGARSAFGDIAGGSLSPAPTGRGAWWTLHLAGWHPIGFGSGVPAPAYVGPLAVLGTIFGPGLTMSLLLVGAPLAALWGAWRFLRVVGRLQSPHGMNKWLLLWAATTYALVPLVAGAWGSGRWGVVVAAALLPWMGHAALGFADPDPERRWRAAWRAGLLLTLLTAFTPVMWWLCAVLVAVVLGVAAKVVRAALADRSVWGPPVAALGVPLLLLAPWWLPSLWEHAGDGLFLDIGRWPTASTGGLDLLAGRFGDVGAPWWLGLLLPVLAALALVPRSTRVGVVVCWLVAAVAAVVAVPLARLSIQLPGLTHQQPGLGAVLLLLGAAWLTAIALGTVALRDVVVPRLVQLGLGIVGLAAIAVSATGLGWFAVGGGNEIQAAADSGVPVFMAQQAERGDQYGVLVLRGGVAGGLSYQVVRGDGLTVGEDEIEALTPGDRTVEALVQDLATSPSPAAVVSLRDRGIRYIVQPAPGDGSVAQRLDATSGLTRASTADRETRAWQVAGEPPADAVAGPRDWPRDLLLLIQLAGVLVVVVLALPSMRRSRND